MSTIIPVPEDNINVAQINAEVAADSTLQASLQAFIEKLVNIPHERLQEQQRVDELERLPTAATLFEELIPMGPAMQPLAVTHFLREREGTSNTIEQAMKDRAPGSYVVMRNESDGRFYAFANCYEYLFYTYHLPEDLQRFHEVTFDAILINMYFDVDISAEKSPSLFPKAKEFMSDLLDCIREQLKSRDREYLPIRQTGNSAMSGKLPNDNLKFSRHLVIPGLKFTNVACKEFYLQTIELLSRKEQYHDMNLRQVLDDVYSSHHSLRCIRSHKGDVNLIKRPLVDDDRHYCTQDIADYFITSDSIRIREPRARVKWQPPRERNADAERVLTLCKSKVPELVDFEIRGYNSSGSILLLNRSKPGHCSFCKRDHDHDHTHYIACTEDAYYVYCRHYQHEHPDEKCYKRVRRNAVQSHQEKIAVYRARLSHVLAARTVAPQLSFPNPTFTNTRYLEIPSDITAAQIIAIQSDMSTGKTSALKKYIASLPASTTIVALSMRIAFTNKLCADFGFESYLEIKGPIDLKEHPRVVTQIDSLHRLHRATPDVLILDESNSLHLHTCNLEKQAAKCTDILEDLLRYSGQVIALDAMLDCRTIRMLQQTARPITTLVNSHNERSKRIQRIYDEESIWDQALCCTRRPSATSYRHAVHRQV